MYAALTLNTRMTDYTDRATCVLFGDGGGAVLVEPAGDGEIGFIDGINEIDGSGGVSLYMPGGGSLNPSTHETVDKKMHFIHQDGPAVYKFAVRKMAELTGALLERMPSSSATERRAPARSPAPAPSCARCLLTSSVSASRADASPRSRTTSPTCASFFSS